MEYDRKELIGSPVKPGKVHLVAAGGIKTGVTLSSSVALLTPPIHKINTRSVRGKISIAVDGVRGASSGVSPVPTFLSEIQRLLDNLQICED